MPFSLVFCHLTVSSIHQFNIPFYRLILVFCYFILSKIFFSHLLFIACLSILLWNESILFSTRVKVRLLPTTVQNLKKKYWWLTAQQVLKVLIFICILIALALFCNKLYPFPSYYRWFKSYFFGNLFQYQVKHTSKLFTRSPILASDRVIFYSSKNEKDRWNNQYHNNQEIYNISNVIIVQLKLFSRSLLSI